MCIIAVKKANQPLPEEKIMKTMFKNNSDGAGFCYCLNGDVRIQKGYMTYEAFAEALNKVSEKIDTYATPMLFHFRIATHGGINPALCHPFPISRNFSEQKQLASYTNLGIVHNGIIDISSRDGASDTMTYIAEKLAKRYKWDKGFYKSKKQRAVIQSEIGGSKMAFLDHNGGIYTVGDFIEDNGILYSNSSYMERDYFFKLSWEDYTDYEQVTPLYDGYVVTPSQMYEIEDVNYFIGKGGKLFEYDYYMDICFETEGVAYTTNGFVATFNEDESIWMNVVR